MAPTCLCAPTIHKGSFRCRHHRVATRIVERNDGDAAVSQESEAVPCNCVCAPTSHPGSFRCHLHRATEASWGGRPLLPSPHAKALRNAEILIPVKAGDHSVGLKKAAFVRTNRVSSESKLRSELNKAMPEIVAAVEDLRISPVKIVAKRLKLPVTRAGMMARASNILDQEKTTVKQSAAVSVKVSADVINVVRPQNKVAKRPPSLKDRRLRAKSDVLIGLKL